MNCFAVKQQAAPQVGCCRRRQVQVAAATPLTRAALIQHDRRRSIPKYIPIQLLGAVASLLLCSSANAATAEANFATKCLGCHVNGGNIVQAGATLFTEDLVKNGVADADSLYKLIYSGKDRMPGFGQDCAPKGKCTFGARLTDEEVQDMAKYVLDRAAEGWKQQ